MDPKKILFLAKHYHPAMGGGEITAQILLEGWVARGGSARAIFRSKPGRGVLRGVEIVPTRSPEAVWSEAISYAPDLIYAQASFGLALEIGQKLGVATMAYVHDPGPFCRTPVPLTQCNRRCMDCPHYRSEAAILDYSKEILRHFDHIIVPSQFMAQLASDALGRNDIQVLYPAVDPVPEVPLGSGGAISMSASEWIKGTDLFLRIAEGMPEQAFVLAGRGNPSRCGYRPNRHPNVKIAGVLPRDAFYGASRLVLMPSRWAEPFGRMGPEAQSAGVLFMGSRVGGIPEAAGEAGVLLDDYLNPDAWVREIQALFTDEARQRCLREKGLLAWQRFETSAILGKFLAWCDAWAAEGPCREALGPLLATPALAPAHRLSTFHARAMGLLILLTVLLGFPSPQAPGRMPVFIGAQVVLLLTLGSAWWRHGRPLWKSGFKIARVSGLRVAVGGLLLLALSLPLLMAYGRRTTGWAMPLSWGATCFLGLLLLLHRMHVSRKRKRLLLKNL